MRRLDLATVILGTAALISIGHAEAPPPSCKPMTRYGVSGCEPLPDQSCPAGYHIKAVNPPNPKMMTPTFLMCVPDKPPAKEEPPKSQPKPNR